MRIAGRELPEQKQIWIALTYIHGIGRSLAYKILQEAGVSPFTKTQDLDDNTLTRIRNIIENRYVVEGRLRQQLRNNIKRLKEIKSYRGIRHERRLPVRGQRTRTNTRTVKGNVRITAAGTSSKKSAPSPT